MTLEPGCSASSRRPARGGRTPRPACRACACRCRPAPRADPEAVPITHVPPGRLARRRRRRRAGARHRRPGADPGHDLSGAAAAGRRAQAAGAAPAGRPPAPAGSRRRGAARSAAPAPPRAGGRGPTVDGHGRAYPGPRRRRRRCSATGWASAAARRWIEGFAHRAARAIAAERHRIPGGAGPRLAVAWVEGGQFCGSRGMALPVLGLRVRLRGEAAETLRLHATRDLRRRHRGRSGRGRRGLRGRQPGSAGGIPVDLRSRAEAAAERRAGGEPAAPAKPRPQAAAAPRLSLSREPRQPRRPRPARGRRSPRGAPGASPAADSPVSQIERAPREIPVRPPEFSRPVPAHRPPSAGGPGRTRSCSSPSRTTTRSPACASVLPDAQARARTSCTATRAIRTRRAAPRRWRRTAAQPEAARLRARHHHRPSRLGRAAEPGRRVAGRADARLF